MIKLYKRIEDEIHYWEAWEHDGKIIFHWGILGDIGEKRETQVGLLKSTEGIMTKETKKRQAEGFYEIPIDEHKQVIVQYRTETWGSSEDLEKNHAIEDQLNHYLGWTGNGHCDGWDIGSGTINVFSYVVDPYIAIESVVEALQNVDMMSGLIVALRIDDSFEVLWPEDFDGEFSYWYETPG